MSEADRVIVVGAGPVGLACALFLRAKGIPVLVLEAEAALPGDMRASTFHSATLDFLDAFGVTATLVGQGVTVPSWQFWRRDTGQRVVFDLDRIADLTAHPYRLQCEQFKLTRAIVARLSADPDFSVVFGATVESVGQDTHGAWAQASTAGRSQRHRGAYLVGADGARSLVRRSLGLELKGDTYPMTSLTVSVDFPFEDHLDGLLGVNYVWTADGHFSLMRVQSGWRVGYSPPAGASIEQAISPEIVQARLQSIVPTGRPYAVTHTGAYSVHRRLADAFRVGRILLAGDAAHLNSPTGGMGMNSGVHDAHALADALGRVMGGASDAGLDRYARQRRAIAQDDVQAQSDTNYRRHRETDPVRREAHWADLTATAADPARHRAFVRAAAMIASVERAATIA